MAVPTTIADLTTSEATNAPLDTETITASTRPSDYLRAHAAILRTLAASTTLAAGATTDLSTVTGTFVTLTGAVVTITGLGTLGAGIYKFVIYNAAHSLTNSATLILLGGANRTVAAGDVSMFVSEGSGTWREVMFSDASVGLDPELVALAGLTSAANKVPYFTGSGTADLKDLGTASGNIPLVGTSSATEALAGLVELATTAEASTGTDTARAVTAAGVEAHMNANALGWSQTWQDVLASRAAATNYTNSTGRPIMVSVMVTSGLGTVQSVGPSIIVDGVTAARTVGYASTTNFAYGASAIVPPGGVYSVTITGTGSLSVWAELR